MQPWRQASASSLPGVMRAARAPGGREALLRSTSSAGVVQHSPAHSSTRTASPSTVPPTGTHIWRTVSAARSAAPDPQAPLKPTARLPHDGFRLKVSLLLFRKPFLPNSRKPPGNQEPYEGDNP